jgi:hypothetical protein
VVSRPGIPEEAGIRLISYDEEMMMNKAEWEDNAPEILERISQVFNFSGYRGRGVKGCLDKNHCILRTLADYNYRYDANRNLKYDLTDAISLVNSLCVFFRKIVRCSKLITDEDNNLLLDHVYHIHEILSITGFEYEDAQILQNGNRELFLQTSSNAPEDVFLFSSSGFIDNDIFFESMKNALGFRHEQHPTSYVWDGLDYSNYYMFKPASSTRVDVKEHSKSFARNHDNHVNKRCANAADS